MWGTFTFTKVIFSTQHLYFHSCCVFGELFHNSAFNHGRGLRFFCEQTSVGGFKEPGRLDKHNQLNCTYTLIATGDREDRGDAF